MRPSVPYVTVATPRKAHIPVMIAPIGKMRILVPGSTKGAAAEAAATAALAEAASAAMVVALAWSEKTPLTKVASSEERVD